jgi:hypothetical protein
MIELGVQLPAKQRAKTGAYAHSEDRFHWHLPFDLWDKRHMSLRCPGGGSRVGIISRKARRLEEECHVLTLRVYAVQPIEAKIGQLAANHNSRFPHRPILRSSGSSCARQGGAAPGDRLLDRETRPGCH